MCLPLFVPADRAERIPKAAAARPDAVIVDLEDAVAPAAKPGARSGLAAALGPARLGVPILVRVNAAGTAWHRDDLAACADLPLTAIMLPKAETAEEVSRAAAASGHPVIALVETARGLHAVAEFAGIAARLAFGSIDYAADIGAGHTREALLCARSMLVIAARAAGRPAPLDGVTVAIDDAEALADDCRHALSLGMTGKLLIHPRQIAPARRAFTPGPAELDWARSILAAVPHGGGAAKVNGTMVDAPVIRRAEQIVRRAEAGAR
ncbi:CoA ester lyase [Nitratireductor sp. ZSWI3]|uniref:HpcH/HpaI aldolase/citrate lyase family protein n=1 Tax=Nitratireductor sp. ZSWI3 TaxID=2966359 RepID=UPI00215000F1|nr:CoA ester lyase [Nitratireductor sp. ZSWI3]MCR4265296.1 CoA ester lyase [Nitratireductor sp. ZSWI3]